MPLIPSILQKGLSDIAENYPDSASDAANKMAKAYADYARGAVAGGLPITLTGGEEKRLAAALLSAFAGGNGTPATGAMAWAAGLTAFWLSPPVVFGAGVVTVALFPAVVPAVLGSIAAPSSDKSPPIAQVVQGLDTATRTVLVLIPPSPTPVPIS